MDASHFLVGGLTAIAVALLVWIEIRSRQDTAAQTEQAPSLMPHVEAHSRPKCGPEAPDNAICRNIVARTPVRSPKC